MKTPDLDAVVPVAFLACEALAQDISSLAQRLELDQSEVFRRAMSLYIRAKRDEGDRIILRRAQGTEVELVGV